MNETISIATSTAATIRDESSTTQIKQKYFICISDCQSNTVVSATYNYFFFPNDVTIPNSLTALVTTHTFVQ